MKKIIVAIVIGLLLAGCATVPITGRRQLSFVPNSELFAASAASYDELMKTAPKSTNAQAQALVTRVGKRIAAAAEEFMREEGMEAEIKNYAWEFTLIDDAETVNAFCMPGGKIVVYTGLLPVAQDEAGLAVVMGHEVAHALANHGGERMSQALMVQLGEDTLATAMKNKPEKTQKVVLSVFGAGANIGVLLPYSRTHETEADRIGLILMARAGYAPKSAVSFWERMSKAGGATPIELLSTHPAPTRRIEAIEEMLPEAEKYIQ